MRPGDNVEVAQPSVVGLSWAEALDVAEARYGGRDAFVFEGPAWAARLDFTSWLEASRLVAAGLHAFGVVAGDRVGVLAPGSPVWPVIQVACSHLGAVVMPVNVRYRRDELAYVLAKAKPRAVVTVEQIRGLDYPDMLRAACGDALPPLVVLPRLDVSFAPEGEGSTVDRDGVVTFGEFLALAARTAVPERVGRPDDAVLLQFTSGTTAFPKGALLSSVATLGATYHLSERMGLTEADRFFSTQPFYHVGGAVATTLPPLTHGCTMVVPERYQVEEVFRLIAAHRCTARTGQAAMYAMELSHPAFSRETFTSLRRGWAAGTSRLKRLIVEEMGIESVISTYGLTETAGTSAAAGHDESEEVRLDTCGAPLPGVEVAVAVDGSVGSPEGTVGAPEGTVGEVCVRGWQVMIGYYDDPAATAEAIDGDRWFHTGDLGFLDGAGNLHFVDRIKDMIKPGGENVSAAEVERVIAELDDVAQVAVVGMPDDRLGEVPAAFVELREGSSIDELALVEYCRASMASFKVPKRFFLQPDWPLTESGKIQKHVLRARLAERQSGLVGQSG